MQRRISGDPCLFFIERAARIWADACIERFQTIHPFLEEDVSLSEVARRAGMSARMAWYWVERYRKDGLVGLARQVPHDKGRQRLSPASNRLSRGWPCERGRARQLPPFTARQPRLRKSLRKGRQVTAWSTH